MKDNIDPAASAKDATTETALTLQQHAMQEIDAVAEGISALQQKYGSAVFDVSTTKGMAEAKAARQEIRQVRYDVERIRKEKGAELKKIATAINDRASDITAPIRELEDPIDSQIKAEEERKEAEREAKRQAEEDRQRAEQAERERAEREAEEARLAEQRRQLEAEQAAQREAEAKAEQERQEAAQRAEADRLAREQAEAEEREQARREAEQEAIDKATLVEAATEARDFLKSESAARGYPDMTVHLIVRKLDAAIARAENPAKAVQP